jgi:IclR family pca regulon transcriptional regulator
MTTLAERIQESTSLAVLSERGDEIQYTAQVTASHVMSVDITVGTRLPARATSMGRVLLPDVDTSAGYALVDEELEQGVRSIAVPVRDRTGRVIAALNAATHVARRTVEECVHDILPDLKSTASRIETDLHTAARFTRVPLT